MAKLTPKKSAIKQINTVQTECNQLLNDIKAFSPPDLNGEYNPTFRLIATPMLYSIWERCFTLNHAIALRLIRDVTKKTHKLAPPKRAIWLLKEPWYRSLVDQLRSGTTSTKVKKGEFTILSQFLTSFDNWADGKLDASITTDELVMTFSNVDNKVVELNAQAIGIDSFADFQAMKFGRLNDLVGQRNDIGHGAIIQPPANDHFIQLLDFTENLVKEYCKVFTDWINTEF